MSYFYDDYEVSVKPKSYVVKVKTFEAEEVKVRIDKKIIEKIDSKEDPEMVAIVCAVIEFIKTDAKKWDKPSERTIIKSDDFAKKLSSILMTRSIEDLIHEVSCMKYYEIREYFED